MRFGLLLNFSLPHSLVKLLPAVAVLFLSLNAFASDVSVHDGDTLRLDGQKIRLWGIDAPELQQQCQSGQGAYTCGQSAREALQALVAGRTVECEARYTDRYRRTVSICFADGVELNEAMVRAGWALDYVRYSKGHYAEDQAIAQRESSGIWSGRFVEPWVWRSKSHE